jgi:hypothetical protein
MALPRTECSCKSAEDRGESAGHVALRERSRRSGPARILLHEPVARAREGAAVFQFTFGVEPMPLIVPVLGSAILPHSVGAIGHFFFVHEYQPVSIERLEPLVPRDGSEEPGTGKIESNSSATIIDGNGRRTGGGGLPGGRLRAVAGSPSANHLVVFGGEAAPLVRTGLDVRGANREGLLLRERRGLSSACGNAPDESVTIRGASDRISSAALAETVRLPSLRGCMRAEQCVRAMVIDPAT